LKSAQLRIYLLISIPLAMLLAVSHSSPSHAKDIMGGLEDLISAKAEKNAYLLQPVYVPHPPKIDGVLDDEAWGLAEADSGAKATNFVYRSSNPPYLAKNQTTVWVAYDKNYLYFAWDCSVADTSQIVASLLTRDSSLWYDDHVQVIIDPTNSHSSGYYFGVTPNNVQMEGYFIREGEKENINWDTVWKSATKINDKGWVVEMAIPFRAFRMTLSKNCNWAINFFRLDRRDNDQTVWKDPGDNLYRISSYGTMQLKEDVYRGVTLNLQPYLSTDVSWDQGGENRITDWGGGVDFSSRILPNTMVSGTIYPDFTQLEADPDEINLNPDTELFYPEKRPFFLEGQEHFDTPLDIFYTRRIGDIKYGGNLNTTLGKTSLYLLDLQADDAREMKQTNPEYYNWFAGRLNQGILPYWSIGATMLNRHQLPGNTTIGSADTTLSLGNWAVIDGQMTLLDDYSLNRLPLAYYLGAYRSSATLSYDMGYEAVPEEYARATMSYLPNPGIKGGWGSVDYNYWLYSHGIDKLNTYHSFYYYQNYHGMKARDSYYTNNGIYFSNHLQITGGYERNYRLWDYGAQWGADRFEEFKNDYYDILLGYKMMEWASSSIWYMYGHHFYWIMNYMDLSTAIKLMPNLGVEMSVEYEHLKTQDKYKAITNKPTENIWIFVCKLNYQITKKLFARTFIQSSGLDYTWTFNGLIGYNYLPGSNIYLAYNEWREYSLPNKPLLGRILFLKASYDLGL
jgi:hypothetical protein